MDTYLGKGDTVTIGKRYGEDLDHEEEQSFIPTVSKYDFTKLTSSHIELAKDYVTMAGNELLSMYDALASDSEILVLQYLHYLNDYDDECLTDFANDFDIDVSTVKNTFSLV